MDIIGKESLENMLKEYKGTLMVVSHDRFFINKISDCILDFENGNVKFYPYGYEEYLEKKSTEEKEIIATQKQEKAKKQVYINPLKEKDKLEKKIKKIEEEISKKEEEISNYQNELLKEEVYSDYVKVAELQEKIDNLNKEIEENMKLWEVTEEELEKINNIL